MKISPAVNKRHVRAFTLIEIMVVVGIILILGVLLLTVGGSVRQKSQVSATRAELHTLEGLVEQFERENHQLLPETIYQNDSSGYSPLAPALKKPNFIDALYAYPGTRDQLVSFAGDRLKLGNPTDASATSASAILDSFGRPISFVPANYAPGMSYTSPAGTVTDLPTSDWTASVREYLRSSGPDQTTNWKTQSAVQNTDDILSYEAAH